MPYLLEVPDAPPRLIILPSDDDASLAPAGRGRPIDASYSSIEQKLQFMDQHGISTSVISLANPWLDFLGPEEAQAKARGVNDELESLCEGSGGRLAAFGALPISAHPSVVAGEVERLSALPQMKGVILGTTGRGDGLDDPELDVVWKALEECETMVFLHPHYGLPTEVFGPRAAEYGHVLPLALGFPMETTVAVTRMYLCGVFDRFPRLRILVAHAGGTVPFLAGRVDSCVQHERHFLDAGFGKGGPKRSFTSVLKTNIWLDAVVYSAAGVKAAVDVVGADRVLFGTDHPFFPPLERGVMQEWHSVKTNVEAVYAAFTGERKDEAIGKVFSGNAKVVLGLTR